MNATLSESTINASDQKAERLARGKVKLEELSSHAKQLWLDGLQKEVARLLQKARPGKEGCLEWRAAKDWNGYGSTYLFKKQWRASRLFYFLFKGTIPDGHMILHTCDNPCCINPDHLFSGTAKDNMRDCVNKGRALGPRGEMNGRRKLNANQVLEISARYKRFSRDGNNMYDLAKQYGVHPVTIHDILNGKRWRSVTGFTKKEDE